MRRRWRRSTGPGRRPCVLMGAALLEAPADCIGVVPPDTRCFAGCAPCGASDGVAAPFSMLHGRPDRTRSTFRHGRPSLAGIPRDGSIWPTTDASCRSFPISRVYRDALEQRICGKTLERVRIQNPFVLRTAVPPHQPSRRSARRRRTRRLGKRIVLALEGGRFSRPAPDDRRPAALARSRREAAGADHAARSSSSRPARSRSPKPARSAGRRCTSSSARRRSRRFDAGGLEILDIDLAAFAARLRAENHTLEARADRSAPLQRHRQRLLGRDPASRAACRRSRSPRSSATARVARLFAATRAVLARMDRAAAHARRAARFPEASPRSGPRWRCTAASASRARCAARRCSASSTRENECNYCARCQTGGVVLADRALSRLLHKSWPRSIDELHEPASRGAFRATAPLAVDFGVHAPVRTSHMPSFDIVSEVNQVEVTQRRRPDQQGSLDALRLQGLRRARRACGQGAHALTPTTTSS